MEPEKLREPSVIEEFNKIAHLFEEAKEDALKTERGYRASCTRLRKKMQLIKDQCNTVRKVSLAGVRRKRAEK